jgi:signal transduction histidine kinase/ActR/RegA family two-component response regulator
MTIWKKIVLKGGLLIFLLLIVQGGIFKYFIDNEIKVATDQLINKEMERYREFFNELLEDTHEDLEVINSHKALEDYFTSRYFDDGQGMLESESSLENFFISIEKAKPKYSEATLLSNENKLILRIINGKRVEIAPSGQGKNLTVETKKTVFELIEPEPGEWILKATKFLNYRDKPEGKLSLYQPIDPIISNIFNQPSEIEILYLISTEGKEVVAQSSSLDRAMQNGLLENRLEGWIIFPSRIPELNLNLILAVEEEKVYFIIHRLEKTEMLFLVSALIFSLFFLGKISKKITLPMKKLAEWANKIQEDKSSQIEINIPEILNSNEETQVLAKSFQALTQRTIEQNRYLEVLVDKRTKDLQIELGEHTRTAEQLKASHNLINAIRMAQSKLILGDNQQQIFEELLEDILSLTQSEFGFIGRIIHSDEGKPFLRTLSISDIAWNDETRALYEKGLKVGFEFHNLESLFGRVITTGEVVISNDPANDSRRGGLPAGHPPLEAFLGLPITYGDQLLGMVGIANRQGGYDNELVNFMRPFLSTCATFFTAINIDLKRKEAEASLYKEKEIAEKANRAKSEFLSRMSHELRTPMNAILGFGQLLEMTSENCTDNQKDNMARILSAGHHLLELINEVLDLSRIESGKVELSVEIADIIPILENAVSISNSLAQRDNISLEYHKVPRGIYYAEIDPLRFKQVILNLISNAIKYNKPNGSVIVSCEDLKNGMIRIGIKDTGHGIPEDKTDKLFKPFERFDVDAESIEGTGIGLTIAQQFIELMHGKIGFECKDGVGSYFYIDLPVADKRSGTLHIEGSQNLAESLPAEQNKKKILYIEDIPDNRTLVDQILRSSRPDIELITAYDALDGIGIARAQVPALILMDIHMPGMDGLEAFRELQTIEETKGIPVIALTADAMNKDIQGAMDMGFCAYITKPIDIPSFLDTIDECLG